MSLDPRSADQVPCISGVAGTIETHLPGLLAAVRDRRPLVHHFANLVTMQAVANATRALGALPVMATARDDAEQMAGQSDVLVLSLGTPSPDRLDAMLAAGRRAAARGIPIVFDPVGVGATAFRSAAAQHVLGDLPVAVIRANRGEAAALLGHSGQVRGVESAVIETHRETERLAPALARAYRCVAAVTGARDAVADAGRVVVIANGHPWLEAISGAGCMATALVGAFCAVGEDLLVASAAALVCFGVAAEIASARAAGPGTLVPCLVDALYHLSAEQVVRTARLEEP